MPTLRGRRMYGVFRGEAASDYFAAVRLDDVQTDDMGFERGVIPGGLYARKRIRDWSSRLGEIAEEFDKLRAACAQQGYTEDDERPGVEYCRSADDLIIMVPVTPK